MDQIAGLQDAGQRALSRVVGLHFRQISSRYSRYEFVVGFSLFHLIFGAEREWCEQISVC